MPQNLTKITHSDLTFTLATSENKLHVLIGSKLWHNLWLGRSLINDDSLVFTLFGTYRYISFCTFWVKKPCKCYIHYHVLSLMTLHKNITDCCIFDPVDKLFDTFDTFHSICKRNFFFISIAPPLFGVMFCDPGFGLAF